MGGNEQMHIMSHQHKRFLCDYYPERWHIGVNQASQIK